jgi:hypothetical protein
VITAVDPLSSCWRRVYSCPVLIPCLPATAVADCPRPKALGDNLALLLRRPRPPPLAAGDDPHPCLASAHTTCRTSALIWRRPVRRFAHTALASRRCCAPRGGVGTSRHTAYSPSAMRRVNHARSIGTRRVSTAPRSIAWSGANSGVNTLASIAATMPSNSNAVPSLHRGKNPRSPRGGGSTVADARRETGGTRVRWPEKAPASPDSYDADGGGNALRSSSIRSTLPSKRVTRVTASDMTAVEIRVAASVDALRASVMI